ncbi:hypothetical protein HMPREF0539_1644 [Lacticaseibacillus rhamnosus LMS2-1]|uniref:Uncharacterized protein n=1 Tax=Lacticaseibacillus rhamnosus (strain LMS2-1) TaxID=525361 RepID=C2JXL0_LACRM|nr:hypothetical protein HMPREF0539_1644 [Lacticaseibacillus rhamnosus LMS2-1]
MIASIITVLSGKNKLLRSFFTHHDIQDTWLFLKQLIFFKLRSSPLIWQHYEIFQLIYLNNTANYVFKIITINNRFPE